MVSCIDECLQPTDHVRSQALRYAPRALAISATAEYSMAVMATSMRRTHAGAGGSNRAGNDRRDQHHTDQPHGHPCLTQTARPLPDTERFTALRGEGESKRLAPTRARLVHAPWA